MCVVQLIVILCMYGVDMVSKTDKIIGLFCRIVSLLQGSCAKEIYNLIDPTNRSHPIVLHSSNELYYMHKINT